MSKSEVANIFSNSPKIMDASDDEIGRHSNSCKKV